MVTRAPAELAQALRSSHGIDVTDVPVHRTLDAATEARQIGARAFTRGGRVFLPEDAGALTSSQARGLLAHELVHAAQQRRLGGALPGEGSTEGRLLEAEAVAAERQYSTSTIADEAELVHAPKPVSAHWVDNRITQRAPEAIDYLADTANLNETQRVDFTAAADLAVQQIMDEYHQRNPQTVGTAAANSGSGPFATISDEQVAQLQFLEIVNTELQREGKAPQASLSPTDAQRVREMFANSGNKNTTKDSSPESRWAERNFGAGSALGADIGGLLAFTRLGRVDRHDQVDASGNPIIPGAHPTGTGTGMGTVGTGTGIGTGTGTGTGIGTGIGAGAGSGQQDVAESSAFTRWQEDWSGSGSALGADIGGLARLFGRGRNDQHPADPNAAAQHPGAAPATAAAGTPAAAAAAAHGHDGDHARIDLSHIDMEELAVRIYDRLRSRLRRELLVDRERAGLLTDFR